MRKQTLARACQQQGKKGAYHIAAKHDGQVGPLVDRACALNVCAQRTRSTCNIHIWTRTYRCTHIYSVCVCASIKRSIYLFMYLCLTCSLAPPSLFVLTSTRLCSPAPPYLLSSIRSMRHSDDRSNAAAPAALTLPWLSVLGTPNET